LKTLHLSIIAVVGIAIIGIIVFFITSSVMKVPPSTPSGNNDDMQRILSFCSNPEIVTQGNDVFVICQHPQNSTDNGIFNLPPPKYKRIVCQSTFGCSGTYNYIPQIPDNLLSPKQEQESIDKVLQVTGLRVHYPDIQLDHFLIQPRNYKWFADVQFIIPHILNGYGNCGWYTSVQIDLQTFEVYPNGVAIGTQKC
jgi:hypothetical protein